MCLMCEFYYDICYEPECVARATGEELFTSRDFYKGKGFQAFVWKKYTEPCEHIKAEHGPECELMTKTDAYDCNCDLIGGKWVYYN